MSRAEFFRDEHWTAGVVGLGYVGLPLSMSASVAGLDVVGFDISEERVEALNEGRSHVEDVDDGELRKALRSGTRFTSRAEDLAAADALFVAVPSPLGRSREPDMSYIRAAAATVEEVARPGQLVCLESTTYPGTTEEFFLPALERAGLRLDEDVHLCFSPERVDPGNVLHTSEIPKVVGGVSEQSGEVGAAAYQRFVHSVHVVKSARAAELTKLLENTYRAVNIALVNEMAQVAHVFDIDIWEVIDAAATKPFGFQAFYPGPGVGGHCIPLDPQFLAWRARELRVATRFIDLAEDVNLHMPEFAVRRVSDELNRRGLPVFGTEILGVGMAYKRNVGDDRESPAVDVLRLLERRGARLGVMDPHVDDQRIEDHGYAAVAADADLSRWSMAVVLTDHDAIDYGRLAREIEVIFDTRGVYRRLGLEASNVVAL